MVNWKLPLAGLPDPLCDVWRRTLDEEVEHDRGGDGEAVPVAVLGGSVGKGEGEGEGRGGGQYQVTIYCIWLF